MEELPRKLKLELSMVIHQNMYSSVAFFQKKDQSFIAWVARLIKPMNFDESDYIYKEGEEIFEVYFLVTGSCGYVLPRFKNKIYSMINPGEHFGHVDLGDEKDLFDSGTKIRRTAIALLHTMIRRFTVLAFTNCELLALSVKDIFKMKLEFPLAFAEIFDDVRL